MKKKLIALILTLSMILALAACGGGKESKEKKMASKEGVYKVVDLDSHVREAACS